MTTLILFRLSLVLKGLDAVLEVAGGVLLLLPVPVNRTVAFLLQHELYARYAATAHLEQAAALALEQTTAVGAAYLMVHGLAKIILIVAVFREKKWGYVGLTVVLSLFAILELGRGVMTGHVLAYVLGVFDLLIVYLIAKEYRIHFHSAAST